MWEDVNLNMNFHGPVVNATTCSGLSFLLRNAKNAEEK
jgi:hypothetical protein